MRLSARSIGACCLFLMVGNAHGQVFDERFDDWPVQLKINGTVLMGGGLDDTELLTYSLQQRRASGKKIIALVDDLKSADYLASLKKLIDRRQESKLQQIELNDTFPETVAKALQECEVFGLLLSEPLTAEQCRILRKAAPAIKQFVANGGTIFCDGASTEAMSAHVLLSPVVGAANPESTVAPGCGVVLDCVIKTEFAEARDSVEGRFGQRIRPLLVEALGRLPRHVGVAIERNTIAVLRGRKVYVVGRGRATFCLPAGDYLPARTQTIAKQVRVASPESYLIDLTEWRRDAIDRTLERFPPLEPRIPHVAHGTLVIVGGGGMPSGLMEQIVEMAGGRQKAKMVYIPCMEEETARSTQRTVESWKKMGVNQATFIHTKDRVKANTDEEFYAPLQDATGLWFGGGRQWNFADSYYGTKSHELMKAVLKRGGVIGGSSAGASVQGRYLARATPIGNFRIMAPGYERGGLGFLSGVAIDQHFTQRKRQKDLTQLVNRYPQLLGIGIDEATAIIVRKSIAKVVGRGRVFFYDRRLPVVEGEPDYTALPKGSVYDLAGRRVLFDASRRLPPLER